MAAEVRAGHWASFPGTGNAAPGGRVAGRAPGVLLVAGAHGGAGTSTLAALLSPAWDLGTVPAPSARLRPLRPAGRPVVLVARCTVPAAGRAIDAAGVLAAAGAPPDVLVIVGDGLPEPAEARYRFRLLSARMPVVRMPFVTAFRAAASPLLVTLPRPASRALAAVTAHAARYMTAVPDRQLRRPECLSCSLP
jgi:hypothetical protein